MTSPHQWERQLNANRCIRHWLFDEFNRRAAAAELKTEPNKLIQRHGPKAHALKAGIYRSNVIKAKSTREPRAKP